MSLQSHLCGALAALALFVVSSAHAQPAESSHYRIQAQIHPATGAMQVELDMHAIPLESTSELTFLLHADLQVASVNGANLESFNVAPYDWPDAPHLKHISAVTLHLREPAGPDRPVALQWRYGGVLQDDHMEMGSAAMTAHWMELPAEAVWVPMWPDGRALFTWQATVELPEEYEMVTAGQAVRRGNRWELFGTKPSVDVPLIASDRMQTREFVAEGGVVVRVHHAGSDDALADFVAHHAPDIVSRHGAGTTSSTSPLLSTSAGLKWAGSTATRNLTAALPAPGR